MPYVTSYWFIPCSPSRLSLPVKDLVYIGSPQMNVLCALSGPFACR